MRVPWMYSTRDREDRLLTATQFGRFRPKDAVQSPPLALHRSHTKVDPYRSVPIGQAQSIQEPVAVAAGDQFAPTLAITVAQTLP